MSPEHEIDVGDLCTECGIRRAPPGEDRCDMCGMRQQLARQVAENHTLRERLEEYERDE